MSLTMKLVLWIAAIYVLLFLLEKLFKRGRKPGARGRSGNGGDFYGYTGTDSSRDCSPGSSHTSDSGSCDGGGGDGGGGD